MEFKLQDLRSPRNPKSRIKIMKGHFASEHAHVNTYIDISTVTCRMNNARETAKVLVEFYSLSTKVDTIVCVDGTELIGAFMAEMLSANGIGNMNGGENISVVTPEVINRGQMIFRDNTKRMIEGKDVLILSGSITTGESMLRAISAVIYFKGRVSGVCAVFSAVNKVAGLPVHSIFSQKEVADYQSYSAGECPLCAKGQKLDAMVNSFGYSML
ncbi:orotate phosphoribosyltransferase [Lachnospiraceae bacterium PF1-21]|uniref:orotate phosphoribosyltransferase n=1 Tax=Ohessyouella blattaphilus TaxID=2949333 RepID=UPI00255E1959|nr:orotate phosphoribosyltransferase [Lachnospiraceae bacterium OttesenSCG-928-J05]